MSLIRFRKWQEIVNAKTKRPTAISVLRGTLLRYVTQSLDQIEDEQTKKRILWEEMFWLNSYWAQPIPSLGIPNKYWQRLFILKSIETRRYLYEYLHDEEKGREITKLKLEKRKEYFLSLVENKSFESIYSKSIYSQIETKYNPERPLKLQTLACAARLGEFFIIDGGFEYAHFRHSYFSSLVERVIRCFKHINRFHSPAYIIITDLAYNYQTSKHPLPHEHSSFFHSTRDLYLDLFDKNRLIYLTPDSPNEMTHYDHEAIYILGGIYDAENKQPLTYEKAVRQNIRHCKLPLEKYLTFHETSSRALAFHEVYNIMMTLKHTNNDWIQAFRHVPKRKIATRIEAEDQVDEIDDDDDEEEEIEAMASG